VLSAIPATAVGSANGRSTSASRKAPEREAVAHQHPGDEQAEHHVERGGGERQAES
jgi:hypothetical protein